MSSEPYQSALSRRALSIPNAGSLSAALDLFYYSLLGVVLPAAWTAADLTFQVSADGVTYADLYDRYGVEYAVKAAASRHVLLDPADFAGARYLKIRSGTAVAPVSQAAQRDLVLVVRALG